MRHHQFQSILMMNTAERAVVLFLFILFFRFCRSIDTISPNISIKDTGGDVLISSGKTFAFGFFSAGNDTSGHRYVGIWYQKVSERNVVWVANRDNPVNDTSGLLSINDQGNLVLYAGNQTIPVWSTNISEPSNGSSKVQLMDSGNLVLLHQKSNKVLWQSFDYPTDTLLPHMKLGVNRRTGFSWILSSWKSQDDPGTSTITYQIDPNGFPQLFVYKDLVPWWRGGPWIGKRWAGVPEMNRNTLFITTFVNNEDEVFLTYSMINASVLSRMMVVSYGASRSTWNDHDHRWFEFWSAPKEQCDNYGYCGPYGFCDPYDADNFMCNCLPGFQPKSPRDWFLRDGSGGCVRNSQVSMCRNGEGFVKLTFVKVPDTSHAHVDFNMSLKECEQECYRNCSCSAYSTADESGTGCLMWFGDLIDTRAYSSIGQDLNVRVDAIELAKYRKSKGPLANNGVKATVIISIVVTVFLILFLVRWLVRRKKRAMKTINSFISFNRTEFDESGGKDLPLFDLNVIAAATKNFSVDNKLGEGGFGSVYKGLLDGETEIAVKRLAKNSGQGAEEFKNEVSLIVKLQHRNLVRILGVCVQGEERMLIYEFLPNKSLDYFIFDEMNKSLLDWPTRFNIICGIARGILYLHQDSRLRIIHRDLKASNVLLDASMNPKISDFGMARIFGVDQNEANTNRVVGTYGYMSPEYAMQGLFSVKSDVYSFGVLLLEIITGRKNNSYFQETTNLIGYVWELWKEHRAMDIVDPVIGHSHPDKDILKCIHIGLLCVQDSATDRPTMSTVVFMLGNNNDAELPYPKQPAFIMRRTSNKRDSTSGGISSQNEVSVTMIEPR